MDTTMPVEAKRTPARLMTSLLINRNFALLWSGQTISRIGDVLFNLTLILWVTTALARNLSWAFVAVAGIFFLPPVTTFLVGPFAGVFVDRWDKRRTMLVMDAARAGLILLLTLAVIIPLPFPAGSEPANITLLIFTYLVILLVTCCGPFFYPARLTLIRDIVAEDDLPRAFGLAEVQENIAILAGPPIAAILFISLGIQWVFVLNALSFVISFLAILLIRAPVIAKPQQDDMADSSTPAQGFAGRYVAEFREGWNFFSRSRVLLALVLTLVLATFATAGITVLNIFFVTNNLHTDPQYFPYADAIFGVGALLGALVFASRIVKRFGAIRVFWVANIVSGFLMLIFARQSNFLAAMAILFLYGIAQTIFNVAFGPLLLKATPREMMGRIGSLLGPPITLAMTLSIVIGTLLVTTVLQDKHTQILGIAFGPVDVMYTASGILVVASSLYAMISLDRLRKSQEDSAEQTAIAAEAAPPLPDAETLAGQPLGFPRRLAAQICLCAGGLAFAGLIIGWVAQAHPILRHSQMIKTAQGHPGVGQPIDGIRCAAMEGTAEHIHIYVEMFVDNQQMTLPAGIGIVAPHQPDVAALTSHGNLTCLYSLHVHQTDNIIHVESPVVHTFTLGEFSDIWGQPLSKTQFAGYTADSAHPLIFELFDANGHLTRFTGDPRAITFTSHETLVILYNSPKAHPLVFTDWNGL